MNRTLSQADGLVTVVASAPLTNIAVAIRMDRALWRSKVSCLVWMGGAVASGGNATAWGEANARYDPEAAHIVLSSGLPLLLYPWDVFLKVGYSKEELQAFGFESVDAAGSHHPAACLAGRLLCREIAHFGADEAFIGDAGAVMAALQASAITTRRLPIAVELQGSHTRGMTVCDLRCQVHPPDEPKKPANAEVVVDVDVAAFKALFTSHVLDPVTVENGAKRRRVIGHVANRSPYSKCHPASGDHVEHACLATVLAD